MENGPTAQVAIEVEAGYIRAVATGPKPEGAVELSGLTLPGLANAHSHAFHRALRGRTHAERGTFWTWRERMYAVADRLNPDSYYRLARAAYAEMALTGVTCVGEFHYLHHDLDGKRFADPNAMGQALIAAAADAGVRLTLLDTLYLSGGFDQELSASQRRFSDGDVESWWSRVAALEVPEHVVLGAAAHSVRAVPAEALESFAEFTADMPVHVHLSEQRAENEACRALHGLTPTQLLAEHGLLRPNLTAVHATHLSANDIRLLGSTGSGVCLCPTTERDLADGIGPARALADAGSPLSLGSDSHAIVDLFEEARALEMHERLASEQRGHFTPGQMLSAATDAGHAALGWDDAGCIEVGMRADLVSVVTDSPRTAGAQIDGVLLAGNAADVHHVVIDGRVVVSEGRHLDLDVGRELAAAIGDVSS
nr:formimidoylglutamate deiminase [Natronoglycomyces albus]